MKKVIRASKNLDGLFGHKLFTALKQFLPKNCYPRLSPRYDVIDVSNCSSLDRLIKATEKALNELGYDVYSDNDDLYAVKDEWFIRISLYFSPDKYTDDAVIIDYGNQGNAIFEDWYVDPEEINSSTSIRASEGIIFNENDDQTVASQIAVNIKAEWDAIEGYQKLIPFFEDKGDDEAVEQVREIISDELNHAEVLRQIMRRYDGNIETAED